MKLKSAKTGREFDPEQLRGDYRRLPPSVLADLAEQCHVNENFFDADPCKHAYAAGQHSIWVHINNYRRLERDQINDLYAGRVLPMTAEEIEDGR